MITVGTDPEYGNLYSDGPIIQVPGQTKWWNSRLAPNGDRSRILTRRNDYINSVVAIHLQKILNSSCMKRRTKNEIS